MTTEERLRLLYVLKEIIKLKKKTSDGDFLKIAGDILEGFIAPKVVELIDAEEVAIDASLGNVFSVTLEANRFIGNPTNPVNGQNIKIRIKQDATGGRSVGWGSDYDFGDAPEPSLSTGANMVDIVSFTYNSDISKWTFDGIQTGFNAS